MLSKLEWSIEILFESLLGRTLCNRFLIPESDPLNRILFSLISINTYRFPVFYEVLDPNILIACTKLFARSTTVDMTPLRDGDVTVALEGWLKKYLPLLCS